jgi:DNA-binding MarR family transcriptional regulator
MGKAAGMAGEAGFEQWPEGVEFGILRNLIGYAIRRAQIAIYKDFEASVSALTPPLFAALVLIDANPDLNQTRLGQAMGVNRAAAMALIDRLAALKLVKRASSTTDRRANVLHLTDHGRRRLAQASAEVVAHDARVAHRLSKAELAALRSLLAKF